MEGEIGERDRSRLPLRSAPCGKGPPDRVVWCLTCLTPCLTSRFMSQGNQEIAKEGRGVYDRR